MKPLGQQLRLEPYPTKKNSTKKKSAKSKKETDGKKQINVPEITSKTDAPKKTLGSNSIETEELDEEALLMANMLGFSSFSSTKGEHVIGTDVSAVDIIVVPKYRQYMHKNRPSPTEP
jgi:hypothetical protein